MKSDDLMQILDDCCNDISFSYNGESSGVMPEVHNYKKIYHAWHGDKTRDYISVNEVMSDKFFSGKSLNELADMIDIDVT